MTRSPGVMQGCEHIFTGPDTFPYILAPLCYPAFGGPGEPPRQAEVPGYLEPQQEFLSLNMAGLANQTSELIGGLFGQSLSHLMINGSLYFYSQIILVMGLVRLGLCFFHLILPVCYNESPKQIPLNLNTSTSV